MPNVLVDITENHAKLTHLQKLLKNACPYLNSVLKTEVRLKEMRTVIVILVLNSKTRRE